MFIMLALCLTFVYIVPGQMMVPDQVFYWPIKPFIFYTSNSNLDGILPFMYKRLQELCCPSIDLVQYHLINKTFDQNNFYKSLEKENNVSSELQNYTGKNGIWFPLLVSLDENKLKRRNLKRDIFMYSPKIGVIVNKNKITVSRKIFEAIKKSVPIASHAIGFILLFSLLVWLVESLKNNDFSKCFIKGFGTSLWWSVVTLATVGYGDIVPKSMLGRFFSVLWMLIGIILISGLTGMFSSIITTNSFLSIQHQKIAALNNSIEFILAQKNFNITANKETSSPILIVFGIETYLMSISYPSTSLQNDVVLNCLKKLNIKEILKNIQEIYGKIPTIDSDVQQKIGDFWDESYVKMPSIVTLTLISVLVSKDVFYFIYKIYERQNHKKVDNKTDAVKNTDTSVKIVCDDKLNVDRFLADNNDLLKELLIIKEQIFLFYTMHKEKCPVCLKQDSQV
nr:uncharacterized protein LOC105847714 isoform X2 [Hydra vulgaris]